MFIQKREALKIWSRRVPLRRLCVLITLEDIAATAVSRFRFRFLFEWHLNPLSAVIVADVRHDFEQRR